jgi:hypothetical protein
VQDARVEPAAELLAVTGLARGGVREEVDLALMR